MRGSSEDDSDALENRRRSERTARNGLEPNSVDDTLFVSMTDSGISDPWAWGAGQFEQATQP